MVEKGTWFEDASFPALLRGAGTIYTGAVRQALIDSAIHDLPRNGAFVLGAIAGEGLPLSRIIGQLGISKQAAGELVETLVTRGYLERRVDTSDRRRHTLSLTARGKRVAAVVKRAIQRVDGELEARVGASDLARTRRTLAEIIEAMEALRVS